MFVFKHLNIAPTLKVYINNGNWSLLNTTPTLQLWSQSVVEWSDIVISSDGM